MKGIAEYVRRLDTGPGKAVELETAGLDVTVEGPPVIALQGHVDTDLLQLVLDDGGNADAQRVRGGLEGQLQRRLVRVSGLAQQARALVEPLLLEEARAHGDPALTEQRLDEVAGYLAERDATAAWEVFAAALEQQPDNIKGRWLLGHYYYQQGALKEAIETMSRNFLMALFILFMLMAGLFRSLKDSALVVMTIPLAGVGGVIAIRTLNLLTFQPMDLLTMIGFIILLGLVVNNAILLVDQTRRAEREGMGRHEAVENALRVRLPVKRLKKGLLME